jgi:hypothetical protein
MSLSAEDKEFLIRLLAAHAFICQGALGSAHVDACEQILRKYISDGNGHPFRASTAAHDPCPRSDFETKSPSPRSI